MNRRSHIIIIIIKHVFHSYELYYFDCLTLWFEYQSAGNHAQVRRMILPRMVLVLTDCIYFLPHDPLLPSRQALAYHGQLLGVPATVIMPTVAPIMKVEKCRVRAFRQTSVFSFENQTSLSDTYSTILPKRFVEIWSSCDHSWGAYWRSQGIRRDSSRKRRVRLRQWI